MEETSPPILGLAATPAPTLEEAGRILLEEGAASLSAPWSLLWLPLVSVNKPSMS